MFGSNRGRKKATKMNMKMPDFNVKKLVKEAGSTLSRVVQVGARALPFLILLSYAIMGIWPRIVDGRKIGHGRED